MSSSLGMPMAVPLRRILLYSTTAFAMMAHPSTCLRFLSHPLQLLTGPAIGCSPLAITTSVLALQKPEEFF